MRKTWIALLIAALAGPAMAQTAAERGHALFMADGCYQCHGTTGAGGGAAGVALVPLIAMDAFKNQLRMPRARMPAYSKAVLSDAQIADIVAYLQSVPGSPKAADIPELNR